VGPRAILELPELDPHAVEFYEHEEAEALYGAIGRLSGLKWRVYTELGMDVGLRLGELSGLHGHRTDWLRSQITVVDVMTRLGLRQHPKTKNRTG